MAKKNEEKNKNLNKKMVEKEKIIKHVLTYGNKLTINTGNYENISPLISETIEIEATENKIKEKYQEIIQRVDSILEEIDKKHRPKKEIKEEKGNKENKEIKEFKEEKGKGFIEYENKKYIRVTSVVGQMYDLSFIPNIEIYANEGKRVHDVISKMLTDKQYKEIEGYIFKKELFDNLLKNEIIVEKRIYSKEGWSGQPDVIVKAEDEINVIDWKTGKFKEIYWIQLSAYANYYNADKATIIELKTGKRYEVGKDDLIIYYRIFKALLQVYKTRFKN